MDWFKEANKKYTSDEEKADTHLERIVEHLIEGKLLQDFITKNGCDLLKVTKDVPEGKDETYFHLKCFKSKKFKFSKDPKNHILKTLNNAIYGKESDLQNDFPSPEDVNDDGSSSNLVEKKGCLAVHSELSRGNFFSRVKKEPESYEAVFHCHPKNHSSGEFNLGRINIENLLDKINDYVYIQGFDNTKEDTNLIAEDMPQN